MKSEGSSLYSQKQANGLHAESRESSTKLKSLFIQDIFYYLHI
jgi:hypothetical protein